MPGWIETRAIAAEQSIEWIKRWIQDWTPIIKSAQQAARTASQGGGGGYGGGGSTAGAFFCQPSGTVAGASGTWPSVTPVSFIADVYSGLGGVLTLAASGATVWNYVGSGLVASMTCPVIADGGGSYAVYSQSCT